MEQIIQAVKIFKVVEVVRSRDRRSEIRGRKAAS
jgi:hypothetical protein